MCGQGGETGDTLHLGTGVDGGATAQEEEGRRATTPPLAEVCHLAPPLDRFVGRESELRDLAAALDPAAGPPARVVVVGLGGAGKSALALRAAWAAAPAYEVVWELDAKSSGALEVSLVALAAALNVDVAG